MNSLVCASQSVEDLPPVNFSQQKAAALGLFQDTAAIKGTLLPIVKGEEPVLEDLIQGTEAAMCSGNSRKTWILK